ncbi:hypothetical protein CMEL01_02299 [Colletotrichum melonis]|uniref:Uncharacterized protein n=1 Tax=Colletotrichum melonis TaxID=1209925 RepID=A0AAI9UMG1_9PEZI|nr:hypothetical protein CMEL01_02299 [Colletotrichum melonis]
MGPKSNKSIVHGDDSPSSRKYTDAEEMLSLQRERLCLFVHDNQCPNPMLPHIMGAPGVSIEDNHERKLQKIKNVVSKVEK